MRYFTPETDPALFQCPCGRPECDAPPPSPRLLDVLEAARERFGRPILVTSGPRCAMWNALKGGEDPSAHLLGDAADLACVLGSDRFALIDAARTVGVVRYGVGNTFLHVDVTQDSRFPQGVAWHYYGVRR